MGLFSRKKNNSNVTFIGRQQGGNGAEYEVYNGKRAEDARIFLETKTVSKSLYYIVVETPEGNWGKDIEGLYLEKLLPFQLNLSLQQCKGLMTHTGTLFGLKNAAQGASDNFVAKVECGNCKNEWHDALRYKDETIVKCPKCSKYNIVDTFNINVSFY